MDYRRIIEVAAQKGIEEVEVYVRSSKSLDITLFQNEIDSYNISENEKVTVRGAYQGKLGYVNTENLKDDQVEVIVDKLIENARVVTSKEPYVIFEGSPSYPSVNNDSDDFSLIPANKKIDVLHNLYAEIKNADERIKTVDQVNYGEQVEKVQLFNSKGLALSKHYAFAYIVASAVAAHEDDTRSAYDYQLVKHFADFDVKAIASNIVERLVSSLHPTRMASNKYPVVIENKTMASLLGAFVSMFSGEAAVRNLTLLKGREGEVIGSDKVTIVDDPLFEKSIFAHSFDDQGVACFKKEIVSKGVFNTLLYDLKTAMILGKQPTGNGFSNTCAPTNLYLQAGDVSFDEMIKDIKEGLYVTSLAGLHSGLNPVSGDFSAQASGYKIVDGKVAGPVSLIVVSGNFLSLLKDVENVANDLVTTISGVSSPSVLVKELAVSGE